MYRHDYPQPWSPSTPMANRRAETLTDLNSRPASDFAPFGRWEDRGPPPGGVGVRALAVAGVCDPPVPPHTPYPNVPTLVMTSDLDYITPIQDARIVGEIPNSTLVDPHNEIHITVLEDQDSCAANIHYRLCGRSSPATRRRRAHPRGAGGRQYRLHLRNVVAATTTAGDRSNLRERRMAAAGAETVADTIAQWWTDYVGTGLRGDRSYSGGNTTTFRFAKTRMVPGRGRHTVRPTWATTPAWFRAP